MHTRLQTLRLPLILLVLLLTSPIAHAVPASDNAALRYWRAWWLIGDETLNQISHSEYGVYAPDRKQGPEQGSSLTTAELLAGHASAIQLLIEAASMPRCDFGIDYHKGVDALLPNLAPMRRSVQLLALDAERLMSEGDVDAAVTRMVAAIQISQHAAVDRTLINSLVSMACFSLSSELINAHKKLLDENHRRMIAHALTRFSPDDPFHAIGAIRSEAEFFGGWMLRRVDSEWSTFESFAFDIANLVDFTEDEAAASAMEISNSKELGSFQDELRAEIQKYQTWMHLVAEAWTHQHPKEALDALEAQLMAGNFGHLAQLMAPSLTKVFRSDQESHERLQSLRAWAEN